MTCKKASALETPTRQDSIPVALDDGNGFVIVSGDDSTEPVLGYSETGMIDPVDMPQNMRSWLQHYAEQIEYIQSHPATARTHAIENCGEPIPVQITVTNGVATAENILPFELTAVSSDNKPLYASGEPFEFTAKMKLLKGEIHEMLGYTWQRFNENGELLEKSVIFPCGQYYVSEGETFDVNINIIGGLPEGRYMFCLSIPTSDYFEEICVIDVKDGATAVQAISAPSESKDAPAYNLQGQRIAKGYKGIVIQNGKLKIRN